MMELSLGCELRKAGIISVVFTVSPVPNIVLGKC